MIRNKLMGVAKVEIRLLKARMNAAEDCLKFISLNPAFISNTPAGRLANFNHMRMSCPSMIYFADQETLAMRMIKSSIEMKKTAQIRKVNRKLMKLNQLAEVPVNSKLLGWGLL